MSGAKDLELFHYGVKGMQWGVSRSKKDIAKQRDSSIEKANKRLGDAENKSYDVFESQRKANRASGQGRLEARRNALKSPEHRKAESKMINEARSIDRANAKYKTDMKSRSVEVKAARKNLRKEIGANFDKNFSAKNPTGRKALAGTYGGAVAGTLLGGPLGGVAVASFASGTGLARSSGYSRGASVAIGLVGGTPGGLLASEISVRRRTRGDNG